MATSLARQLTALRTPASSAAVRTEVYSGPFIIKEAEADVCDPAKLRIFVTESLAELIKMDLEFVRIGDVLLEEGVDVDNVSEVVEDALFLLSPYCLLKPAQWLLQWLVTNFKVHYKHPDIFFLCVLPVYDYDIYRRAIEAIVMTPGGVSKFPNWFPLFKQSCFPTTKLGLHRHCASDRGFFKLLCELMLKLSQHVAKYPKSKIQRVCTMFIMTILGALENCANVGEQQLHNLLQVVLAGFKADHPELNSSSNILLSYLLPRVTLNNKAAAKITKVIGKSLKRGESEESLFLVILMTRTQPNVDQNKMIGQIIKHQAVINSEFNKATVDDSDDVKDLADNVVYTLSLLVNSMLPPQGETLVDVTCDQCSLLSLLKDALITSPELSSITASNLASTIADLQGALPKHEDVLLDTIKQAKGSIKKIISHLKTRYPEEYQNAFAGSGHADILFIGGNCGMDPTEKQIGIKKCLQDNELLNFLMQDYLITQTKVQTKEVSKIVKKNKNPIRILLDAEPDFLISQVEPDKLERLLVNLVKILVSQPDLQALAIKLLCCEEVSKTLQDPTMLELTLLPLLFVSNDSSTAKNLLNSHFATVAPILSLITSLRLLLIGKDPKCYNKEVFSKLNIVVSLDIVDKILGSKVTRTDPQLVTLVLLILISRAEKLSAFDGSKTTSRLVEWTLRNLAVTSIGVEKYTEDLVIVALETSAVPSKVVFEAIDKLVDGSDEKSICSDLFNVLPFLIEREMIDVVDALKKVIRKNIPDNLNYINFLAKKGFSATCLKTSYLSLVEAEKHVDETGIVSKILKEDCENDAITYILAIIFTGKSRLQRAAYNILAKIVKTKSQNVILLPLVTFFVDNKSAIISDISNIDDILKKEPLDDNVVRELLFKCLKGDVQIFSKLSPIFCSLSSKKDVSIICSYGSHLLTKDDETSGLVLATIVSTFTKQIIPNLGEEDCWNFFSACLATNKAIEQRVIKLSVGQSFLNEMANISTWSQVSKQLSSKVFSACIKQFNTKVCTAARNLLVSVIKFDDKIVLEELKVIWGVDYATVAGRVGGRGKFSLLYGSNEIDPEDETRWLQTTFLLEILERVISSTTNWSSLIQPMFFLLKKCADLDLEESSYRMSLILTVLLKLLQSLTDPQLKQLEVATLNPELLVHCIRSSPSPETRQTALLALARVAITTPDCVLHNSITIFTFMGSHLLKIDSQRSFQVACEAIEIIIPAVKTACESIGSVNSGKQLLETNLSIINTFVDASRDMPAHRYNEFLFRLLQCLGEKEYLWIATLLVVKASAKKSKRKASQDRNMSNQRLVDLICRYTARAGLETALRILVNLRNDSPAVRKIFGLKERKPGTEEPDEWDVLRLRSLLFVAHLLSSSSFRRHMSGNLEDEMVIQILNLLLEAAILSIETYESLTSIPVKLQRSLATQSERVLEHCLSLLPSEVFFHLLAKLISSSLPSVRRRALEVVTGKLSSTNQNMDNDSLASLVEPMVKLAISEENAHIQQLALMTLRQLTRQVPSSSLSPAASSFTPTFLSTITNPSVLGSAIISVAEVLNCLGARAVVYIPLFTAWLLDRLDGMMEKLTKPKEDDKDTIIVASSVILGLQKLIESFAGFMNPSVSRLVVATCRMSANNTVAPRVKGLAACLSKNIQPHTLLPLAKNLLEAVWSDESAVATLVEILADSAKTLEKNQLGAVSKQYVDFFMFAFTYREKHEKKEDANIKKVEQKIIDSFLAVTLRLSLEDFRPILYRVMNAQFLSRKASHLTTLFHVVQNVAARLKSLFSFALDLLVSQATAVLSSEEDKPLILLQASLTSLKTALTYNKVECLNTRQYEELVAALLETYNVTDVPVEELADCLAQLAAATEDDTNWKHLNYQVLLSLRAVRVDVRLAVLEVLEKFVSSRSDTYLAVLPDAVPFMAELLEDDDQVVENKCRNLIQHMETTFGQNIESYFV